MTDKDQQLSEEYVRLGLAIDEHLPGYVDSYTGPEEWRQEAKRAGKVPPAGLVERLDRLADKPQSQAWWTVKRQAMTADAHEPLGLYLGTTSGEVWASRDEGKPWTCLARHLPEIYAGEGAVPAP